MINIAQLELKIMKINIANSLWVDLLVSLPLWSCFILINSFFDPNYLPKTLWIQMSILFLVFLKLIVGLRLNYESERCKVRLNDLDIGMLLLTAYVFIHTIMLSTFEENQIVLFGVSILYYYLIRNHSFKSFERIIASFCLCCLVLSIHGILQYFNLASSDYSLFTVVGNWTNPGPYTNFLSCLLPFCWLGTTISNNKLSKVIAWGSVLSTLCAVLLTSSRTSWLACAFGSLVVFQLRKQYLSSLLKEIRRRKLLKPSILVVFSVTIVLSMYLFYLKKDSALGRLFIYQVSYDIVKSYPFFGVGIDNFKAMHNEAKAEVFSSDGSMETAKFLADSVDYAFNEWLHFLIELGLFGFIIVSAIVYVVVRQLNYLSRKSNASQFEHGIIGSFAAVLVSTLFSYPFHDPPLMTVIMFNLAILSRSLQTKFDIDMSVILRTGLSVTILGFVIILFIKRTDFINAQLVWNTARIEIEESDTYDSLDKYKSLSGSLDADKYFHYNYGALLCKKGLYKEALIPLVIAEKRLNDPNTHIYLGMSYEKLGKLEKAFFHFEKAGAIMPFLFLPKFYEMNLYRKLRIEERALEKANHILEMPVKVESEIVDWIKDEAMTIVNSNCSSP